MQLQETTEPLSAPVCHWPHLTNHDGKLSYMATGPQQQALDTFSSYTAMTAEQNTSVQLSKLATAKLQTKLTTILSRSSDAVKLMKKIDCMSMVLADSLHC